MKIGLLTTSFPRHEGDLAGNFVLGFARALARRGHAIEVLCPEPAHGERPRFAGVEVRWLRYLPRTLEHTFYGAGVLDNLRRDPRAALGLLPFVLALGRATLASEWDAIVSHWALPCALIGGELARARGIPHLAVCHSADVFVLERLPGLVATRIAQTADAMLFSSRDLRRRFLARLAPLERAERAQRAHVCPMGIDPARPGPHLALTGPTLLSMSRLVPIKGLEHAIEAVRGTRWSLAIAGDGPARRELERRARGAPVQFLGMLRGEPKATWLRSADAFVLPSIALASGRTEGMPTALLEAMEHGLPVIASDTGGVSDVVRDGENGFLVPPGDARAIAAALEVLPPRRAAMSTAARETAAQYHWDVLAPYLDELLQS
ncbi:MAG TPA: glycosyltransferase family 4 protein [Polyangiales bacterium]